MKSTHICRRINISDDDYEDIWMSKEDWRKYDFVIDRLKYHGPDHFIQTAREEVEAGRRKSVSIGVALGVRFFFHEFDETISEYYGFPVHNRSEEKH